MGNYSLILLAILGWGLWGFFNRCAAAHLAPPQISLMVASTSLITIPIYWRLLQVSTAGFQWNWIGILFAVLSGLVAAGASLSYTFALNGKNIASVVGLTSAYPVITLMMSMFFLNEKITLLQGFGFILILIGVVFLGR